MKKATRDTTCGSSPAGVRWGRFLPHTPLSFDEYKRDIEVGINYFELLGVPEEADAAEVVSAFRSRIRAIHPDTNAGGGDPEQVAVLVRARSTLAGPEREAYVVRLKNHRMQRAHRTDRTEREAEWPPVEAEDDPRTSHAKAWAQAELVLEETRTEVRFRQAKARAELLLKKAHDEVRYRQTMVDAFREIERTRNWPPET